MGILNDKKYKIKKTQKRKRKRKSKKSILVISSLIFITNIFTAIYKKDYLYATLFSILAVTSLMFHSNKNNKLIMLLDKTAISLVVFYGGYVFYNLNLQSTIYSHLWRGFILSTFLFCILVYYYGYIEHKFCFHSNKTIGNQYHAMLHFIGSIGHHMIILSE